MTASIAIDTFSLDERTVLSSSEIVKYSSKSPENFTNSILDNEILSTRSKSGVFSRTVGAWDDYECMKGDKTLRVLCEKDL